MHLCVFVCVCGGDIFIVTVDIQFEDQVFFWIGIAIGLVDWSSISNGLRDWSRIGDSNHVWIIFVLGNENQ